MRQDSKEILPLRTLSGHSDTVWTLCYSAQSNRLVSGSADSTCIVLFFAALSLFLFVYPRFVPHCCCCLLSLVVRLWGVFADRLCFLFFLLCFVKTWRFVLLFVCFCWNFLIGYLFLVWEVDIFVSIVSYVFFFFDYDCWAVSSFATVGFSPFVFCLFILLWYW